MADETNSIDDMLAELSWQQGLGRTHHKIVGENGAMAVFPDAAEDESAFEQRCAEMHAQQTMTLPEPKPIENTFARRPPGTLQRGD